MSERVWIFGSRVWTDEAMVRGCVAGLDDHAVVLVGRARGVDTIAEDAALERGLEVRAFPADWERYGKSAGYVRNLEMAGEATRAVAFWDGTSKGTKHGIDIALKHNLPLVVESPALRDCSPYR